VGNILDLMGVDPIPKQKLAVFSMKGDARKWYRSEFSEKECLATTWAQFIRRFDLISSATRAGKEAELLALEQWDMCVLAYENKFINLSHFTENMFQTEERKARMFEKGLRL